jgi:uroporphyrin-III C-methyltransferase / precorrin-2 dehydrogenase / sirohydrochlorin ferrochelatase
MSVGHVSLVGAGPGDPGLLTRRAAGCLRRADLVLYDALVDERVIGMARRAQRFFVGKRAGRHALAQHEIHALMIRAARRGRYVVRLKGGDPFVFGRGGEEALALLEAGIPFDVVPGVTSVVAAPASAGIPVTHREVSAGFVAVSGHDVAAFAHTVGMLRPNGVTLVIVMGVGRRLELAATLVNDGWAASTPAAIVDNATAADQQVWRGTLASLSSPSLSFEPAGPALIVVGAVAALDLRTPLEGIAVNRDAALRRSRRSR